MNMVKMYDILLKGIVKQLLKTRPSSMYDKDTTMRKKGPTTHQETLRVQEPL